jgi:hypothetical protein
LENLRKSYAEVWAKAGSRSDKKAEEEHLDILIKGLEYAGSEEAKVLKEALKNLKNELVEAK